MAFQLQTLPGQFSPPNPYDELTRGMMDFQKMQAENLKQQKTRTELKYLDQELMLGIEKSLADIGLTQTQTQESRVRTSGLQQEANKLALDYEVAKKLQKFYEGHGAYTPEQREILGKRLAISQFPGQISDSSQVSGSSQASLPSAVKEVLGSSDPSIVSNILSNTKPSDPALRQQYDMVRALTQSHMSESDRKAMQQRDKYNEEYKAKMLYETVPNEIKRADTILGDTERMKEIWNKIPDNQKGWLWGNAPKGNSYAQEFQALANRILFEEVDKLRGLGPASENDMKKLERTVPEIILNDESFEYLVNSYENIVKRVKKHGEFMNSSLTPSQFGGLGLDLDAANFLWNNDVLNNPIQGRPIAELMKEAENMSEEELEALARRR